MNKYSGLLLSLLILIATSCGAPNFMGAKKWNWVEGLYVERWYQNPRKPTNIPKGTAFYGSAAENIRNKFIVKYITLLYILQ